MSTIVRSHNGGHHYHPHYHHHDIARWRACKLWSCSASSSPDRLTRGSKLSSSLVVLITTVCYHNQHCCAHCYLYWWQPPHHFKAKVKRSGGNWNMRGKLLCVISRKLLSQFVIMSRHLPHHNDYRKLKVFIILIIMNQLRYDVMNPHNLYSLLVEKLLVHETGLTLF